MDTGLTRLRHLVLLFGFKSMDREGKGPEGTGPRSEALRRYFAECCDRYIGERPVELQGRWARLERGPDPLNTRMAFVLQQLTDDPADFGIRDLRLENDRWLDDFAEQLSRAPLIWGEPSDEEKDRRTEYLVLCWLVCVERGSTLLQSSIRRAMGLDDARRLDAFQYLAAAAMLLLRNTQLSWPEAVFAFRREILDLAPNEKLPSATKSWNKSSLRDSLTDSLLQKAFGNLCAKPHGEENSLPALLGDNPDAALLRELALLPNARNNDYLYLMQSYLDKLTPGSKDRRWDAERAMELAELFRRMELDVSEDRDRVEGIAEALGAPPEEVDEDDLEGEGTGKTREKRQGTKVPFRMLRHTLYLLMGQRQDQYYGKESDIRDLVFRLAFACGMNRQETEQLLREQEMPGIDFKTAPELLYAYYADRLCGNGKTAPTAYATARLAQRVYALRRDPSAEGEDQPPVALEATFYVSRGYRRERKWSMQPGAFLNWMEERQIPAQDSETLLSRSHDARQMLIFCSQLFRARRSVQRINRQAAEAQQHSDRAQTLRDLEAERLALQAESREMDRIQQRVNSGLPLFAADTGNTLRTDLLKAPVTLTQWRQAYVSRFFPFDDEERDYRSFYFSELGEEKNIWNYWNSYTIQKLDTICCYINENKMLSRDDYLCLLFTEYMMEYPLRHPGEELAAGNNCVARFARESSADLAEARMQPFCPEKEPQMARAFHRAVEQYLETGRHLQSLSV